MDKLYVVVRGDLPAGLQAAQACHAMRLFAAEHPELERAWFSESNNLVVLSKPGEEQLSDLAKELEGQGYVVARFHEPDLGGALTAICVEPRAGRMLSTVPLALRRVVHMHSDAPLCRAV